MDRSRIGIIGLGGIATRMHIPALQTIPSVEIQAGAEVNPQQAERTQRRFSIPRVYESYRRMLDEEELDAAYVCLPNALHADAVRAALDHSLHVFCEKPMGLSASEALSLDELAEERGRLLMPGYNMRYVPNYTRARNLVLGKRIGRILQIQATMAKPGPYTGWDPKSDWYHDPDNIGVLYDQGSHAVDLIRYVCDVEITTVEARASSTLPGLEIPDSIAATFSTKTGAVGTLNLTWGAPANLDMLIVHGTAGSLLASWKYFEHLTTGSGVAKLITFADNTATIVRRVARSLVRLAPTDDPYAAISRDFITAIRTATSPRVTARDGVHTLETLNMIARALSTRDKVMA